jgi:two-component system NarL family sensor kinase
MGPSERDLYIAIVIVIIFVILLMTVFFYFLYQKQKKLVKVQQQSVTNELLKAETERYELATKLHNDIVPYLAGVKLRLGMIDDTHPDIKEECIPGIEKSIEIIRGISKRMAPMGFFNKNFLKGIEYYVQSTGISKSLHVEMIEHHEIILGHQKNMFVYKLLQELVLNVFKHSKASHLKIEVSLDGNELLIRTADNGIGFPLDTEMLNRGMGLRLMQILVDTLGGKMFKADQEMPGTRYNFRIPNTHEIEG